ncbi:Sec-independent protein translocase subunit TatB [Corynebacterium canis]|uniref:Sec-independent protein translocase protein TatB n=1 Tax=Corynebacterium canis TaxID=679663 RepID=A0A5C5TW61_9CORY|nr:Sec-independent protein translocase protein TatB [Corynebacterium canis]TWT17769.1 Sec-independent protein translocase subunit TatB [Corynebacterium canis]WJY74898.1 Sec-independent protein translocase protein TatB [Corynebacterium canis]
MFSNVGWGEIFFLVVIGLIVIGPERLPRVIQDVRAAIFAARNAIEKAKQDLSNELGPEFDELSKPIAELATLQRMGPKAALTKTLFDGDSSMLEAFDPKKLVDPEDLRIDGAASKPATPAAVPKPATPAVKPAASPQVEGQKSDGQAHGGAISWADVT